MTAQSYVRETATRGVERAWPREYSAPSKKQSSPRAPVAFNNTSGMPLDDVYTFAPDGVVSNFHSLTNKVELEPTLSVVRSRTIGLCDFVKTF